MESFERAHVVKKNSKSDLSKKKQIRQMLSGYKQNNNDLIKDSDLIDDASSSVSGFSDLNLTGSSDANKSENVTSNDKEYGNDLNSMSSASETYDFASVNERVSEYTGIPKSALDMTMASNTESDGSQGESMPSMILTKMKEKGNCKLTEKEIKQLVKTETKKKKTNKPQDGTASPPYVSITARNMLDESFESLVGDYTYNTVKNLPWDSHHLDSQFHYTSEFTDNVSVHSDSIVHVKEGNSISENSVDNIKEIDILSEEDADSIVDSSILERQSSVESMDTTEVEPVRVYYAGNQVIIVLKHPAEIYIHGKAEVTSLGGSVEIFGYLLQDKPQQVYAPHYNFAHCLKTILKQNVYYGLFGKLTASGLSVADAEEIVTSIGEFDAVIRLKSSSNSKFNFIEDNFTAADLFSKPSKHIDPCFKQASQILGCSLYLTRPLKYFRVDSKWHEVLKYGQGRSCGIVCGGKGMGKSNFLRHYTNRLLPNGPVLVIDLDPGQAEFTVAGNVSATVVTQPLIGPAFTHLKRPHWSYNLGMINTMDNPKRYFAAVDSLITYCSNNNHFQNMPWIVNTMGMVNALGLKFISYIILRLSPTFLLQMDSNNAKKRFECHLTIEEILRCKNRWFPNLDCPNDLSYEFVLTPAVDSFLNNNSLAPKDERYLNFLAYFSDVIKSSTKAGLLETSPYKVRLGDVNIALNVRVGNEDLSKVLCGKIVALCEEKTFEQGKVFTLSDKPIPCHGHGLIRGIDYIKLELYVVTPIPVDLLQKVNTIVYADWVPELRGQEKYLPEGLTIPYRTCTEYQQRQLMFPPRRRFNPIQLIKMSRNS